MLSLIPTILGVTIIVFLLLRLIPGDPAVAMLGEHASQENVQRIREQLGLNRPLFLDREALKQGDLKGFLDSQYILPISPYTAIACGLLGANVGVLIAFPLCGSLSNIVMRLMDIILAFPSILLAIAILAFLGPGLDRAMIAIGFVGIPTYARLMRATVLSLVQRDYVLAAQAVGAGHSRLLFQHILPNTLSPIIVQSTLGLGSAIIWAGALGFLGLGATPPEPEWGAMLGDSYRFLTSGAWWAVTFPGLAIMMSVLGFNLLGDGLRDALDPRLTR